MKHKKFFNSGNIEQDSNSDIYNFEKGISSSDKEKKSQENHSEYSDHIYVKESSNKEQLYDRNNPFVKIILLILGLIAVFGTAYYVVTGLGLI